MCFSITESYESRLERSKTDRTLLGLRQIMEERSFREEFMQGPGVKL